MNIYRSILTALALVFAASSSATAQIESRETRQQNSRYLYEQGLGQYERGDHEGAAEKLDRACRTYSNADACFYLGLGYESEDGLAQDVTRALDYYETGCELKHRKSCHFAAGIWAQSGETGHPKARILFGENCENAFKESCESYGMMQRLGLGGPVDTKGAIKSLTTACNAKFAMACYSLAEIYEFGPKEFRDDSKIRALYETACATDTLLACPTYGLLLLTDKGGPKDQTKAREILQKSCAEEDSVSCGYLGNMKQEGLGGPVDMAGAVADLTTACGAEAPKACLNLGLAHYQGITGNVDIEAAIAAFQIACDEGLDMGCQAVAQLSAP